MPDSVPDFASDIANLQRKLRFLKKDILGISTLGQEALVQRDKVYIFEAKLSAAQKDWQDFRRLFDQLCAVHEAMGESGFPDKAWEDFYDRVKEEICHAEASLLRVKRQDRNQAPLPLSHAVNETTLIQPSAKSHLPKISIPHFSGDITKWKNFKDIFVSMVHGETTLSKVEKFHYLVSALKGEASSLIASFSIEEQAYDQAWQKLLTTYDNPRVLAKLLIERIVDFDAGSCKSEDQRYEAFLTSVADSVESFRALKLDNPSDFILSTLVLRALDLTTRKQFELSLQSSSTFPTVDSVLNFVRQRRLALKMATGSVHSSSQPSSSGSKSSGFRGRYPSRNPRDSVAFHVTNEHPVKNISNSSRSSSGSRSHKCSHCKGDHHLSRCNDFRHLPLARRVELVRSYKPCWNCLSKGHMSKACTSKFNCKICNKRHHTLIHEEPKHQHNQRQSEDVKQPEAEPKGTPNDNPSFIGLGSMPSVKHTGTVLLGTVRALIRTQRGDFRSARAILDSGSQNSFITASLASKLGAKVVPYNGSITSLAESSIPQSHLKGLISCIIRPYEGGQKFSIQPIVVDRITSALPSRDLSKDVVDSLLDHPLADHRFGESHAVDLLIGGDLYPQVITGAPYHSGKDDLYLLPTVFGLVVSGKVHDVDLTQPSQSLFMESNSDVLCVLKKFWELEEPHQADRRHPDDVYCEEHFARTHSRDSNGRYIVRLPIKSNPCTVGHNRELVTRRFQMLEHKLSKDPALSKGYIQFMQEYQALGHMKLAESPSPYLIPHHGVWQESPHGKKLRVVFDASCTSTHGSLNDILLAGPKLQHDLPTVLTRFRLYPIPLCADLVKMYRQIIIHPEDRHLQHVLWRDNPSDRLQEFELMTVTYGIKPSAFHALRVLRQLVHDEGSHFPLAASCILNDMYVDDIVSGANTLEEALRLQSELIALFSKAGFSLSKWASTIPELIPEHENSAESVSLQHHEDCSLKILGLLWNANSDSFSYTVNPPPLCPISKRTMLSAIARIFDPLGLIAPVVFLAKVLIQEVWRKNLGWDDELPNDLATSWRQLTEHWQHLSHLTIPRYISSNQASHVLLGFCDASVKGYAAAVYLRAQGVDGIPKSSLIMAKTKVAPLKFLSVARLELCGALLLSRLMSSIPQDLAQTTVCFTDSQVVLSWLATPPYELRVFEANRVAQITSILPAHLWRHVSSEDNPADLASRGCLPEDLKSRPIWWSGPEWVSEPVSTWFTPPPRDVVMSAFECRKPVETQHYDWISRFSSYHTLIRTIARILRLSPSSSSPSKSDIISAEEFSEAETRCIRFVQRLTLPKALFSNSASPPKDFAHLSPFLDPLGVVRVGGRLQASDLSYSKKHPILIPRHSSLALILIDHFHQNHFHAGPTLTLALLRGKFWITGALSLIKGRIRRCVHCRTLNAKPLQPFMAALPKERFQQFRAFVQVGVDYAGPFLVKDGSRRKAPLVKAYLCLFVCMASKAIHLELVSSLTTASFLDSLERFISRRGTPSTIWSDHGTNFVGASRFLKDVYSFQKKNEATVAGVLAPKGIDWKFIPPRAPHFGGLWEAGVKSVKSLLTRSLGQTPFSFEGLSTAFCKIEALLNSRPLCALSEDVTDFNFLTPSHLLIGAPLSALPEPSDASQESPLVQWSSVQRQISLIWERWRKEYLHTLQQRQKWTRKAPNLQVGDLVVLLEKRSFLGQWPVARVTTVYPGRDGVTRMVDVRTPNGGTLTRAVSSLTPLFYPEVKDRSGPK